MIRNMFSLSLAATLLTAVPQLHADPALRAGVVEGADMVVAARLSAMSQSAFARNIRAQESEEDKAERLAAQAKIQELTGLGEDDVDAFILSIDLSQITPDMNPAALNTLQAIAAIQLKKSITLDQLQQGVAWMQEENDVKSVIARATVGGQEVLKLTPGPGETWDGPQQLFAGLANEGRTVLMAINEPSLTAAMQRAAGGAAQQPSPELAAAMRGLANQQLQVALVLPAEMQAQIQQQVNMMAAIDPMMGMFATPFAGIKSLVFGATAAEDLNLRLALDLGNEMAATQLAGMFTNMAGALPGVGPMARKMTAAADGGVLRIQGAVTNEDLKPMMNPQFGPGGF